MAACIEVGQTLLKQTATLFMPYLRFMTSNITTLLIQQFGPLIFQAIKYGKPTLLNVLDTNIHNEGYISA